MFTCTNYLKKRRQNKIIWLSELQLCGSCTMLRVPYGLTYYILSCMLHRFCSIVALCFLFFSRWCNTLYGLHCGKHILKLFFLLRSLLPNNSLRCLWHFRFRNAFSMLFQTFLLECLTWKTKWKGHVWRKQPLTIITVMSFTDDKQCKTVFYFQMKLMRRRDHMLAMI